MVIYTQLAFGSAHLACFIRRIQGQIKAVLTGIANGRILICVFAAEAIQISLASFTPVLTLKALFLQLIFVIPICTVALHI